MSLLTDREIVELCAHSDSDYELVRGTMAAVIKKLATVIVEPEVFLREHHRGEVDPYYSKSDRPHPDFLVTPMYFEDQLTTAVAAARVQENERIKQHLEMFALLMDEAAKLIDQIPPDTLESLSDYRWPLCDELGGAAAIARDEILALIGEPHVRTT